MQIELIRMLQTQRDLLNIPRGFERFREYLKAVVNDAGDDVDLAPMVSMNPMSREHVAEKLDYLLSIDAESIAEQATRDAIARLPAVPLQRKIGIVVVDDLMGGWTNRYLVEANLRYAPLPKNDRGWIGLTLWVTEPNTPDEVYNATLAYIYRAAYRFYFRDPKTLQEVLRQEGLVARFAGIHPTMDEEDIAYTREVLTACWESDHFPTIFAGFFGDAPAKSVGYPPLGLSPYAGYQLAIANAWVSNETPEQVLEEQANVK